MTTMSEAWRQRLAHPSWRAPEIGPKHGLGSWVPWNRRRALLHFILQTPFRRMGRRFQAFAQTLRAGRRLAAVHGRVFDLDDLRQVLTVACVRHYVDMSGPRTFAVIGDGYGRLAGLLLATLPDCRVVLVNLELPLSVDVKALRRVWPTLDRLIAVPASEAASLRAMPLSGAFNVSSMQEMTLATIADYFTTLRGAAAATTWFYCSNADAKRQPDGTVVRFDEYSWDDRDEILLNARCPWAQSNYEAWPPHYFARETNIRHRLARLHKLS